MRKFCSMLLFVLCVSTVSVAQGIMVNEDPIVSKMMDIYTGNNKINTSNQIIDGFRIQLLATTDRRKIDESIGGFSARYPGVYAGWTQSQPYYRVRVGAFANRTDASNFLQRIKKDYPDAYIVPDRVKMSEMSN